MDTAFPWASTRITLVSTRLRQAGVSLHTRGVQLQSRASTERGEARNRTTLTARISVGEAEIAERRGADAGAAGASLSRRYDMEF